MPTDSPESPPTPRVLQHGKRFTYSVYLCRCELCTRANAEYMRGYMRKFNARVRAERAADKLANASNEECPITNEGKS
jgi:hypothetical protein